MERERCESRQFLLQLDEGCLLGAHRRSWAMQSTLQKNRVPQEVSSFSREASACITKREFSNSFAC